MSHPEYPSVLQALETEDPVVANCLIDQRAIECILLIKVGSLENQILFVILEYVFCTLNNVFCVRIMYCHPTRWRYCVDFFDFLIHV